MTLTEFLLARIAEDEAATSDASEVGVQFKVKSHGNGLHDLWDDDWLGGLRVDTTRVLAECEAKRRIVEYRGAIGLPEDGSVRPGEGMTYLDGGHAAVAAERERIFRLLALPYAGHPDYDEAWRP